MAERQLNLYSTYIYTDSFWQLSPEKRIEVRKSIVHSMATVAKATNFYNVFPSRPDTDFMIWSAWELDSDDTIACSLTAFSEASEHWRQYAKPVQSLWGFTSVSMYARGKSEQDIDAFDGNRSQYFVVYPFSKTKEWYLMSMDARQGQMNEHIKLGKQYPAIKQLLLYSFGVQDQEFVVAYEMEDLPAFSDLVRALRSTEARRHTSLDTPLITGIRKSTDQFIGS